MSKIKEKEPWQDQIAQIVHKQMGEALKEHAKTLKPVSLPSVKTEKHDSFKDMIDCPGCYGKLEPLVLKKYIKGLEGKKTAECVGCGLGVDLERDTCPGCGGEEARPKP